MFVLLFFLKCCAYNLDLCFTGVKTELNFIEKNKHKRRFKMIRKDFFKKKVIKSGMAIALSAVMSVNAFGATNLNVNVKTAFNKGE